MLIILIYSYDVEMADHDEFDDDVVVVAGSFSYFLTTTALMKKIEYQ